MGQQEDRPSLYTGRLNAVCREEICGSVLLGWYAVDIETGQVWEWDIAHERTGTEVVSTR